MPTQSYQARKGELTTYFDRTAADAWARLTSDAPVSGIRATVRAGRDTMRATLLSWLPDDLRGRRVLDAGCGTGALAVEAARRGAEVVAIDISPTLVALGQDRLPAMAGQGRIDFRVGDMFDPALGTFDHIVAMDSLIHYETPDILKVLAGLSARTRHSMVLTFAPRTPMLATMRAVGRLFPRGDRAPLIAPVSERGLRRALAAGAAGDWAIGRDHRVNRGFYISHAMELSRGALA